MITRGVQCNCSEAVFRLYTLDPDKMKKIIEGIYLSLLPEEEPPSLERFNTSEELTTVESFIPNQTRITLDKEREAFIIQVRNNGLGADWTQIVRDLKVPVEEGESSEQLDLNWARDCTCGIVWFPNYEAQLSRPMSPLEIKVRKFAKKKEEV